MKVTGMRLKSDFLAKVLVLWSMGNKLVPSPLNSCFSREVIS